MTKTAPAVAPIPRTARLLLIEPAGAKSRLRDLVEGVARSHFLVVQEFRSAAAASAALEDEEADLVLAEIGEDARADIQELAAHLAPGGQVPFIVIGRSPRDDVERLALEAGAERYLVRSELTPAKLEQTMHWSLKRAREMRELRDDSRLFRALLDHIPDRIYFKDSESRFLRVSASVAEAHSSGDAASLIGKSDFYFYPPAQAGETYADEKRIIETGEGIVGKVAWRQMPDGSQAWVSSTKLPLHDQRGRRIGTFGITRDLTELKQLELELGAERDRLSGANASLSDALARLRSAHEELHDVQLQLIDAAKLKSIGRLAAGVAHEVKNPLAIISMGLEFLSGKYGADEITAGVLKELSDAVTRADGVIKGLLDFSVPRQLELQPYDLNLIIRTALRLVRGEIGREIHTVELELADLPMLLVDRGKVCQVFVNLFTNAFQAMAAGGTLSVRTRAEQITGVGMNIGGDRSEVFRAGDRVVIAEVADTGPGIPPEMLGRVFEPFFTTKPTGKGTGLGMSVVKSIMNLQLGTVQMRNRDTGGAMAILTFKVPTSHALQTHPHR